MLRAWRHRRVPLRLRRLRLVLPDHRVEFAPEIRGFDVERVEDAQREVAALIEEPDQQVFGADVVDALLLRRLERERDRRLEATGHRAEPRQVEVVDAGERARALGGGRRAAQRVLERALTYRGDGDLRLAH